LEEVERLNRVLQTGQIPAASGAAGHVPAASGSSDLRNGTAAAAGNNTTV